VHTGIGLIPLLGPMRWILPPYSSATAITSENASGRSTEGNLDSERRPVTEKGVRNGQLEDIALR
jgi:hypothetical protein